MHIKALEWFRGLAIVFVVLTHVDASPLAVVEWGDYARRFFSNGTFYFVFISGYLFWHLIDRYEYRRFMIAKVRNVLSPYFFVITPALVAFASVGSIEASTSSLLWHYWVGGGVVSPLWFIPMILLIFVASPIIVFFAGIRSFWLLVFVTLFVSLTSFRPEKHIYPLYMLLHFIGVFLFGIFLKQNEQFIKRNAISLITLSLPALIISLFLDVIQFRSGLPYFWPLFDGSLVFNWAQVQKLFSTLVLIAFLFKIDELNLGDGRFRVLEILSKYSFGIFFFHWYFIFMKGILVKHEIISPIYAGFSTYFIDALIITSLSALVCKIVQFLLGKNARLITGVSH